MRLRVRSPGEKHAVPVDDCAYAAEIIAGHDVVTVTLEDTVLNGASCLAIVVRCREHRLVPLQQDAKKITLAMERT